MVRVIVADDHHLVRQGIRMLLEKADDIEVIGEAEDGLEAVELAERLAPDVDVMDVSMPRLTGVQATELIRGRNPATQVVVLSMHADETIVRQTLRRGARAYVLKRTVGGVVVRWRGGRDEAHQPVRLEEALNGWKAIPIG